MPEAAVPDGSEPRVVLEQKYGGYAHQDGDRTGNGEENDVARLRICLGGKAAHEHTANKRTDESAYNGQSRRDGAYLTGV